MGRQTDSIRNEQVAKLSGVVLSDIRESTQPIASKASKIGRSVDSQLSIHSIAFRLASD